MKKVIRPLIGCSNMYLYENVMTCSLCFNHPIIGTYPFPHLGGNIVDYCPASCWYGP